MVSDCWSYWVGDGYWFAFGRTCPGGGEGAMYMVLGQDVMAVGRSWLEIKKSEKRGGAPHFTFFQTMDKFILRLVFQARRIWQDQKWRYPQGIAG